MNKVTVKMDMSPAQAGALYLENEKNKDRIKELEYNLTDTLKATIKFLQLLEDRGPISCGWKSAELNALILKLDNLVNV